MNPNYYFESLNQFMQELLHGMSSVALTRHDGSALALKYQNLPEIGSLPVAAQVTNQYLKLKDGEIALTNDPYSGGTLLSSMNLVMGIIEPSSKGDVQLLLAKSLSLKPRVTLGTSIEEEGVRIPPTPVFQNQSLNKAVLSAIESHPLAPPHFMAAIEAAVEELKLLRKRFKKMQQVYQLDFSKNQTKNFLNSSEKVMSEFLGEIRTGEKIVETELNDGSKLKLRVDVADGKVIFDFSGSDLSESIYLTHSAALGACTGALVSVFDHPLPINNGILQCIDVIAPEGTMVHAKYPMPVFSGMTDGVALIANSVVRAIGDIDKSKKYPLSGNSICSFEIEFPSSHFFETVDAGAAASPVSPGEDGCSIWRRSPLQPSVENVESRFPIKVDAVSYRVNSGGDGQHSGGRGLVKSFHVNDEGLLKWSVMEPNEKPMGILGGKDAQPTEFLLQRSGQSKQTLAKKGKLKLEKGDKLIVHSAGGGGYGEIPEE